ncbi:hypothetical protein BC826DRAFT_1176693 [Russula brevipes]|nr:hypothetical protein BC826DRAFT_1176693 [Russula brevipes]
MRNAGGPTHWTRACASWKQSSESLVCGPSRPPTIMVVGRVATTTREELMRKNDVADERWRERLEWREETSRQFRALIGMVQGITGSPIASRKRRRGARKGRRSVVEGQPRSVSRCHGPTARIRGTIRSNLQSENLFSVVGGKLQCSRRFTALREIPPASEIGTLLTLRSTYEAGGRGMFDPDWRMRLVHPRGMFSRHRKKLGPRQAEPVPERA